MSGVPRLDLQQIFGYPSSPCFWPCLWQHPDHKFRSPLFRYIPPMSPKNGFKGGPPRGVYSIRRLLERSHAAVTVAYADGFVDSRDEDLAVPNFPGSRCGDDGL